MHNLQSLGHAAAIYQKSPKNILKALDATKAAPVLRLNGVAYFNADDIEMAMTFQKAEVVDIQGQLDEIQASGILDEIARTVGAQQ